MTYPEALQYLDSFINYEKKDGYGYAQSFKLERMNRLVSLLGGPQLGIKSVHIAGSKGKGSTAAIVYSILKSAGYRTGLYTSPHLVSFRERIRINDSLISEADVASLLDTARGAVDKMKDDAPSFFEVYTAVAYLYFKKAAVDFAVYEVGLGGRLDATNVIHPLIAAITPISYEHTDKLGSTLAEIAAEKAGIVKDDAICVSAPQDPEALDVIKDVCKARNARLVVVGRDISFKELASDDTKNVFSVFGLFGEYPHLETGLLGAHQVVNASTAIGVIECLRFHGINIPCAAIKKGVRDAMWDGRLEVVSRKPFVVLDGAQNRASAKAIAGAIRKNFKYKDMILVFGVSKDKDIPGILDELAPQARSIILTRSNVVARAAEPSKIKEFLAPRNKDAVITQNVPEAVEKAMSIAKPEDLILVAGSLFVVGEAKEILSNRNHPGGVNSIAGHTPGVCKG